MSLTTEEEEEYVLNPKEKTILVVDDEQELREQLVEILQHIGYNTLEACDGLDAIKKIEENPQINLVISDVRMPKCSGIELLDRIKARNREIPAVILYSGYSGVALQEIYDRGAEALFPKPFDRKALLKAVHDALLPKINRWNRKTERVHTDKKLSLTVASRDMMSAACNASIINIGRGGMFLAWGAELPKVGDLISFEINFVDELGKKFDGKGIIRWVRTERDEQSRLPGVGIEFTHLDADQTINILEIINYLKTKEFIPRS